MPTVAAARAAIVAQIIDGAPNSITPTKLRTLLIDLCDALDAETPVNKIDATAGPTVNDDSADTSGNGIFSVGSLWVDVSADEAYRCLDATPTAAVWINTTVDATDVAAIALTLATYDPAAIGEQVVGLSAAQTLTNKTLTSPVINAPALGANSVDAITEIAAALRSGSDTTIITGTAGSNGELASFNADGDVVGSGLFSTGTSPFIGAIIDWPFATPPSFGLQCDNAAYSRTTYSSLFAVASVTYGNGDGVAITNAANNGSGLIRITATGHGLTTNDAVGVCDVLGTTEANGNWLVTVIDVNTVDLQGSTFTNAYTSGGDIGTTFNVPERRGLFVRGVDGGAGTDPDAASRTDRGDGTTGDNVGTNQADAFASHDHTYGTNNSNNTTGGSGNNIVSAGADNTTSAAGGNETRPVNVTTNYIIVFE